MKDSWIICFPRSKTIKHFGICFTLLTLHGWLYGKLHPPLAPFISYWVQHGTPAGPRNKWRLPPSCSVCPRICICIDLLFFLSQSYLSLPIILPLHLFMEGKEMNGASNMSFLTWVFVSVVLLKGSQQYRFNLIFFKGCPMCTMSLAQKSIGVKAYKTPLPQDL